jgi:hypothetical protein
VLRPWQSLRPSLKAALACIAIEVLLFAVLFGITSSAVAAVACSVAIFGSASLLVVPIVLRRLR